MPSSAAVILADLSTALRACEALAGVATAETEGMASYDTAEAKKRIDETPVECCKQ